MAIHIIIACGSTLGFSRAYQALSLETLSWFIDGARLTRHGARVDGMSLHFQQPFDSLDLRYAPRRPAPRCAYVSWC